MIQLTFDGTEVETAVVPAQSTALQTAHHTVRAAETALLEEQGRPPGREHWTRTAGLLEQRAAAWLALAEVSDPGPFGHTVRAMTLAAHADLDRARLLRSRLAVTG